MTIYHDYIAPWFDRFMPLPDGSLRSSIEKLATSVEFPLTKILVIEGSKRSAHSNAYFFGFFKNKRIVLFDTLLKESPFEKEKLERRKIEKEELHVGDKAENEVVENTETSESEHDVSADRKTDETEMTKCDEIENEGEKKQDKGCSDEEVLAVLGHELGHWKLNHTLKHLVIGQVRLCRFCFMSLDLSWKLYVEFLAFAMHAAQWFKIFLIS